METTKLKMKIGDHEFEAEGPTEIVQAQLAAWRELMTAMPRVAVPTPAGFANNTTKPTELALDKIMRLDDRIVSLTARGESLEDEILLVLFGQKMLRNNDSITGAEILDGLRQTRGNISRVDYQLGTMSDAGDVISIGMRRARRYRLSNQGVTKAQQLASALIEKVA